MSRSSDRPSWLSASLTASWWKDLNEAQQKAVALPNVHALILAGAGTGKTKTLVARIAALLNEGGLAPSEIMAVTFTNKAAKEMVHRVEAVVGSKARGMTVGTFHGVMYRWIRQDWEGFGFRPNAVVLDADDQKALMRRLYKDKQWDDSVDPMTETLAFINAAKEQGKRPADLANDRRIAPALLHMYTAYQARLLEENALDFAELLMAVRDRLRDDAAFEARWSGRFAIVLVDEFQDTNPLQYDLLERLVKRGGSLFAVGDDDQSIYGFRGARVQNVFDFEQQYAQKNVIRLEENYRSTGYILQAANAVIAKGSQRLGKNLWTSKGMGDKIRVIKAEDENDEASHVASGIGQALRQNTAPSSLAVLYRTNAQSRVIEKALLRQHIPYKIVGGLRFFERAEIKDALAHLRVLHSPDDVGAFCRAVAKPSQGIGPKRIETWRGMAETARIGFFDAIRRAGYPGYGKEDMTARNWVERIEKGQKALKTHGLARGFQIWMRDIGLLAAYNNDEKKQERLENLAELVHALQEFEQQGRQDVGEFLTEAVLDSGEAGDADGVQLSTIHAAKGLEFDQVFWVGVEDGITPSLRALEEEGGDDEERRLAYVAITRARHRLTLLFAAQRYQYGTSVINAPSRYLADLDPVILDASPNRWPPSPPPVGWSSKSAAKLGASVSTPALTTVAPATPAQAPHPERSVTKQDWLQRVEKHQTVRHGRFGEGVVLDVRQVGGMDEARIRFREGERSLLVKFSQLQAVAKP